MKKRGLLLLTACMMTIGMLAGCSSDNEQAESAQQSDQSDLAADETGPDTETNTDNTSGGAAADGKKLVVYYSATGNTEAVADYIADITGGDYLSWSRQSRIQMMILTIMTGTAVFLRNMQTRASGMWSLSPIRWKDSMNMKISLSAILYGGEKPPGR